jgi:hypothetical protein
MGVAFYTAPDSATLEKQRWKSGTNRTYSPVSSQVRKKRRRAGLALYDPRVKRLISTIPY